MNNDELLKISGIHHLQDVRNPLDTTPVADDAVFAECVLAMLEDKNVDCLEQAGVPTFKRSDVAVKFLRKYINNRLKIRLQYSE